MGGRIIHRRLLVTDSHRDSTANQSVARTHNDPTSTRLCIQERLTAGKELTSSLRFLDPSFAELSSGKKHICWVELDDTEATSHGPDANCIVRTQHSRYAQSDGAPNVNALTTQSCGAMCGDLFVSGSMAVAKLLVAAEVVLG